MRWNGQLRYSVLKVNVSWGEMGWDGVRWE